MLSCVVIVAILHHSDTHDVYITFLVFEILGSLYKRSQERWIVDVRHTKEQTDRQTDKHTHTHIHNTHTHSTHTQHTHTHTYTSKRLAIMTQLFYQLYNNKYYIYFKNTFILDTIFTYSSRGRFAWSLIILLPPSPRTGSLEQSTTQLQKAEKYISSRPHLLSLHVPYTRVYRSSEVYGNSGIIEILQ